MRVPLNTHAPLRLPGMLSTAGHYAQLRLAIVVPSFQCSLFPSLGVGVTQGMLILIDASHSLVSQPIPCMFSNARIIFASELSVQENASSAGAWMNDCSSDSLKAMDAGWTKLAVRRHG